MEKLVQTKVPREVAEAIQQRALRAGVKTAAWVRRVLVREVQAPLVHAWVVNAEAAKDPLGVIARDTMPPYALREVQSLTPTDVVYALLHGPGHSHPEVPISPAYLSDVAWYAHPDAHRFLLRGSAQAWRIARTFFDEATQEMRLVLSLDTGVRPEVQRAMERVFAAHADTFRKLAE